MNKAMIMFLALVLVLTITVSGCSTLFPDDQPQENTTVIQENPGEPLHFASCELSLFKIKKVDSIKSDLCLTTTNLDKKSLEAKELNLSLLYTETNLDLDEIMLLSENKTCDVINLLGTAFCLKNNSTCLIIGDHNVCSMVQLVEITAINETNITTI